MTEGKRLNTIYKKLLQSYGKQYWWPADSKLECALGAILTQNTSWKNAEKAIGNVKFIMDISYKNLSTIDTEELSQLIRPAGFYNQKARSIKHLIDFIGTRYSGKIENMMDEETETLRSELLSIKGIGPETADCIMLYAAEKPVFVIDKYTYRLLYRHGFIARKTGYDEMQNLFMENLETDKDIFGEYHALIVEIGKKHCKKRANCEECPLNFDSHKYSWEII